MDDDEDAGPDFAERGRALKVAAIVQWLRYHKVGPRGAAAMRPSERLRVAQSAGYKRKTPPSDTTWNRVVAILDKRPGRQRGE